MKSLAMTAHDLGTGHRFVTLVSWALPGAVLAVLPKCPACFAAYAALWTGVGLSMPVASGLRWALMLVCIASLAFLAIRLARRTYHCQRCTCARETVLITGTTVTAGTAEKSAGCNHC